MSTLRCENVISVELDTTATSGLTMTIARIDGYSVRHPEPNNDGKIRSLALAASGIAPRVVTEGAQSPYAMSIGQLSRVRRACSIPVEYDLHRGCDRSKIRLGRRGWCSQDLGRT